MYKNVEDVFPLVISWSFHIDRLVEKIVVQNGQVGVMIIVIRVVLQNFFDFRKEIVSLDVNVRFFHSQQNVLVHYTIFERKGCVENFCFLKITNANFSLSST